MPRRVYVLTSQYMPLIADENPESPSFRVMFSGRLIHTHRITPELIEATFTKSKYLMLSFSEREEAMTAMALSLKRNTAKPDFIEGEIPFFAVPIVFTVEIDNDYELQESKNLTGEILFHYMETNTIPYFYSAGEQGMWANSAIKMIDKKIRETGSCPQVFTLEKKALSQKVEASYMAANPVREVSISLPGATRDLDLIRSQENWSGAPCCNIF